jgi:hypothetical protein
MVHIGEVSKNEEFYIQNKLSSLGICSKRVNQFNDKEELEAVATAIKEIYCQDYYKIA